MTSTDDHFHSCSRHGSVAFSWQREGGNASATRSSMIIPATNDAATAAPASADQQNYQPVTSSDSSQRQQSQSNNNNNNNNNTNVNQTYQHHLSTMKIVGVLLFNPTISIDEDTPEANILFSERRSVWGSGGAAPSSSSAATSPHAVPNHAGLCSGFRGLASIFCTPVSVQQQQQQNQNQESTHYYHHQAPVVPAVRFVTQTRGLHCFVMPEPNFFVIVTVERVSQLAGYDAAVTEEISKWVHLHCDALRVLNGTWQKLFDATLAAQRNAVTELIAQQQAAAAAAMTSGGSSSSAPPTVSGTRGFVMPSQKKQESRARVATAREMCVKLAPLCHGLYDFVDDMLRTSFAGPAALMSSLMAAAAAQNQNSQQQSTGGAAAPNFDYTTPLSSQRQIDSSNTSIPNHHNQISSSSSSSSSSGAVAVPLFGPLSIAPAPFELRMSAAVLCSRFLDAHISLLRHSIILDAASVLSPKSMSVLAPTILASSLTPAGTSALLSAAGLYKPPASPQASHNSNNNNSEHQQNQPHNSIITASAGYCKFLRLVRFKGDGSCTVEATQWGSQRGVRRDVSSNGSSSTSVPASSEESTSAAANTNTTAAAVAAGAAGGAAGGGAASSSSSSSTQEASATTSATTMDVSNYEKNELWLFNLGKFLLLACEAKSSLLSVPGSRAHIIQSMCNFLHEQSWDLLQLTSAVFGAPPLVPISNQNNNNYNNQSSNQNQQNQQNSNKKTTGGGVSFSPTRGSLHNPSSPSPDRHRHLYQGTLTRDGKQLGVAVKQNSSNSSPNRKGTSSSSSSSSAGATLDEFPHFNHNTSLRIGTVNTHLNWFPSSAVNSVVVGGGGGGGGISNRETTSSTPGSSSSSASVAGGGAAAAAAASSSSSSAAVGFVSRPNEDDLKFGPTPFVLSTMLMTSAEHAAMREEAAVIGQRNLKDDAVFASGQSNLDEEEQVQNHQQQQRTNLTRRPPLAATVSSSTTAAGGGAASSSHRQQHQQQQQVATSSVDVLAIREEQLERERHFKDHNLRLQPNNNNVSQTTRMTPSSSPFTASSSPATTTTTTTTPATFSTTRTSQPTINRNSNSSNTNNNDTNNNRRPLFPPPASAAHTTTTPIIPNIIVMPSDVTEWFTRGSSTYGHSALALITDRLSDATAVETVRAATANTVAVAGAADGVGGEVASSSSATAAAAAAIAAGLPPEWVASTIDVSEDNNNHNNNNNEEENSTQQTPTTSSSPSPAPTTAHTTMSLIAESNTSQGNNNNNINNSNSSGSGGGGSSGGRGGGGGGGRGARAAAAAAAVGVGLFDRRQRWVFATADGDRVAGIVDNQAFHAEEAAETGRRAMRLFGLPGAAKNL